VTRHQRTSFSTRAKFTLLPLFAAPSVDCRRDLLSWRDLHTDAILFQSGKKAGNLAPAVRNPPITPFSGPPRRSAAERYQLRAGSSIAGTYLFFYGEAEGATVTTTSANVCPDPRSNAVWAPARSRPRSCDLIGRF
jgi:hypothetical protein